MISTACDELRTQLGRSHDLKLWMAARLPYNKANVVIGIPGDIKRFLTDRKFEAVDRASRATCGQISINETVHRSVTVNSYALPEPIPVMCYWRSSILQIIGGLEPNRRVHPWSRGGGRVSEWLQQPPWSELVVRGAQYSVLGMTRAVHVGVAVAARSFPSTSAAVHPSGKLAPVGVVNQ